jgi:chromosomal replication initiator protein
MSKKKDTWNQILKSLESKVPRSEFKTWFAQTTLLEFNPDLAIIGVPNKFISNWLRDNYLIEIIKSFEMILDQSPEVHFSHDHSITTQKTPESRLTKKIDLHLRNNLNPSMSFSRFLKRDSNRFACSSAIEVANRPAHQYNPLYIFSECSLGKTHLLNAIGNHVLNKNPISRVRYLSSDTFTSDFTYSIHNKKLHEFRERYCNLNFLLFDDVQLLANRKKTQEELLFIFNSLLGAKKQIVITGKYPPNQLKSINSQLKSRLGWGLLTEIQLPDVNTKVEIITKKAKEDNIAIPDDVIFFLAKLNKDFKSIIENLVRIETYASLNNGNINISMVKSLIKGKDRLKIGIEDIKSITAGYFNISLSELISNKKKRIYSYPRQLAMYLCRKYTGLSLKEIGNSFGNKDHSTVIYAIRSMEKNKDQKKQILDDMNIIENMLG